MQDEDEPPNPLWLLSLRVSIVEAALLLVNREPQGVSQFVEQWEDHEKPPGYLAARNAIATAVLERHVVGNLQHPIVEDDFTGKSLDEERYDYDLSKVDLMALRGWLQFVGYEAGFLDFPAQEKAGFRDPEHPRFAPKLAAVVEAWEAFDESSDERGTPKQRLMKWLRLNASRFGLVSDDGKPSENVIDELAKVANWATTGGAPKSKTAEPGADFDDEEIPF